MIEIKLNTGTSRELSDAIDDAIGSDEWISIQGWGYNAVFQVGPNGELNGYINDTSGG